MRLTRLGPGGWVFIEGARVPYWQFGRGPDLVYVPGLEDGLLAGPGMALTLYWLARTLAPGFRVTALGRREVVPPGYTTRQMGSDTVRAFQALGIRPRAVVALSAGGLVAQWMVADFPRACRALVLLSAPPNGRLPPNMAQFFDHLSHVAHIAGWAGALEQALSVYLTPELHRRLGWRVRLVARLGRPGSLERLLRHLRAFRQHAPPPGGGPPVPLLCINGGLDPMIPMALPAPAGAPEPQPPAGVAPSRRIWLTGEHGAVLQHPNLVAAEVGRFVTELPAGGLQEPAA